jgi:hypothetical protein
MSLNTNLKGRLRNTSLPLSNGLLPLFEAVVNSIHSIEETGMCMDDGKIEIEIVRIPQNLELFNNEKCFKNEPKGNITAFRIKDNGIGFNMENMQSFNTFDSEYKIKKGGRGIGRLLWLKAFKTVKITSVFLNGNREKKRRSFNFTSASGISNEKTETVEASTPAGSSIELDDFDPRYRENTLKTGKAIANSILEHCLWYFLRKGNAPHIEVKDENNVFPLDEAFAEHMHASATSETIKIKEKTFELVHAKLRTNSLSTHTMALCADQRLVCEEKLTGKIQGLHGRIPDDKGEFIYSCFVSSPFLNEIARPERTGFDITESVGKLFEKTEISLENIRDSVIERAKVYLKEHLDANKGKSKERVLQFVAAKAPRYRPILSRIPEEQLNVDPEISDRDLEMELHRHLAKLENELLDEGHSIITASPDPDSTEYQKRLEEYLKKAEDIKKSDLASYISHRRVILDMFEKAMQKTKDGNYAREKIIHQLIMPMQTNSNTAPLNAGNLWLVDERLTFHNYLASDKTISSMPITKTKDTKEPDLCVLNIFDNPLLFSETPKLPPASLQIIEIKRPLRNDAASGEDKDPIEQAVGYLQRIRKGGVTTATGRPIPSSETTPGFCYILADLTQKLEERCIMHDLIRTADGLGYFGYKKNAGAYIEIISFDRLLNMAKERNRAFFEKLGLPAC